MDTERRRLYRNGALILLISALLGLVVASPVPHPNKWMAAHVGGLMVGLLLIGFGAVWPELRLDPKPRALALKMGLVASWAGLSLNIFAALVNFPGPATDPGRTQDVVWQQALFFTLLVVIVPTTLGSFFLVWRGLRH